MGGDDELTFGQKASLKWAGFKKFMYNKEAGTVMGRNGKAWGQLIGFYIVFYCSLAAFWAAMLAVFLTTIDETRPTWNSYVSTPALAHLPSFKSGKIEYNLDAYVGSKTAEGIEGILDAVWESLDPEDQDNDLYEDCDDAPFDGEGQRFCRFDREDLGPCRPPHYGYDEGTPCLYANLNKVWGWEPEPYPEGEEPENVPITDGHIAINCTGEDPEDNVLYSNITVYPPSGISYGYYPYRLGTNKTEQELFINPIVAIQFHIERNQKVRIVCKPYARNLKPLPGIFNSDQAVEFVIEFKIDSDQ